MYVTQVCQMSNTYNNITSISKTQLQMTCIIMMAKL